MLQRLGILFTRFISWLLTPIFWMASLGNRKKVPPMTNSMLFLSATCLAEKIRKREIKSEEIIKAYIERIQIVNPIINAVVEDRFADALEEARTVDRYLKNTIDVEEIKTTQPLLGVPITIKETCQLKGMSFSVGAQPRLGIRASTDGEVVRLLREAGAIPLLVSNTPELCLYWETNNFITGCTKNPYRTDRSPGGSSGGEGALLGSGASVIGIGSDLAGSIRLPALFNGVFGHKPTPHMISTEGHMPSSNNKIIESCTTIGPLTRYAEDLPLMMRVMSGNNFKGLKLEENIKLSNLNVFHMKEMEKSICYVPVDTDIKEQIDKAVKHLGENCKCNVMKKTFDMAETLEATSIILFSQEDIPNILGTGKTNANLTVEMIKSLFGCSKFTRNGLYFSFLCATNGFVRYSQYDFYDRKIKDLRQDFVDSLGDNGVFIYPTFHSAAFQHNKFILEISGVAYMSIFNVLGLPCTSVPMGLNSEGLPVGIQVIAGPNQDKLCFLVAKELERAFGGWVQPS